MTVKQITEEEIRSYIAVPFLNEYGAQFDIPELRHCYFEERCHLSRTLYIRPSGQMAALVRELKFTVEFKPAQIPGLVDVTVKFDYQHVSGGNGYWMHYIIVAEKDHWNNNPPVYKGFIEDNLWRTAARAMLNHHEELEKSSPKKKTGA